MLEYDRIDISERNDVDMSDKSKECMLCHYRYFFDKNFSCYNIMQKSIKFKNNAMVHIGKSAYRIHFLYMS